jgi:hypothetical protein
MPKVFDLMASFTSPKVETNTALVRKYIQARMLPNQTLRDFLVYLQTKWLAIPDGIRPLDGMFMATLLLTMLPEEVAKVNSTFINEAGVNEWETTAVQFTHQPRLKQKQAGRLDHKRPHTASHDVPQQQQYGKPKGGMVTIGYRQFEENADGSNKLCPQYCSSAYNDARQFDFTGHHSWFNPPFSDPAQVLPFLQQYSTCKAKAPSTKSTCFLLP